MTKIAILGAGFMGDTHATAYQQMERAEIAGIFDKNKEAGEKLAAKYGCRAFTDFDEMLRQVEVDVADICLPTFLHEEYVVKAAESSRHIFCEKPVGLSVESLDRMLAAVEKAGVCMLVGQVVRFWPEYAEAKRRYDSGEFGELKAVYAARLSEHPAWSEWYKRVENSGGGLLDLHLHDIDYMCYLLGKVSHVYATGKKNSYGCWNHVSTSLTFENGNHATVEGIIEMIKGYPFTMELRIVGDQKIYQYEMKAGANLEDVASAKRRTVIYEENHATVLPLDERDAYQIELEHFVDCMEQGVGSPVIDMTQVRNVLCTIEAIRESLETGEKVKVRYER